MTIKIAEKTFRIEDSRAGIFADNYFCIAKNSREALQKYLNKNNFKNIKFKRSGSIYTRFRVVPIIMEEGKIYKGGKFVWFEEITE